MDTQKTPLALTYAEVGKLLSVSERTVRRMVEAGKIKNVRLTALTPRIPLAEVLRVLAENDA